MACVNSKGSKKPAHLGSFTRTYAVSQFHQNLSHKTSHVALLRDKAWTLTDWSHRKSEEPFPHNIAHINNYSYFSMNKHEVDMYCFSEAIWAQLFKANDIVS